MLNIESKGESSSEENFSFCETTILKQMKSWSLLPIHPLQSSKLTFTSFGPMWKTTCLEFQQSEEPYSSFWLILFSSNTYKHTEGNSEKWKSLRLILLFYLFARF